jgi:lipopolysaccharide exporter
MMSLRRRAAAGVKWTSLSTSFSAALQVVQLAVLARLLDPADFGLMAMVMVVQGFAQAYVDMGISQAIIHRRSPTAGELSSLYWLNLAAGGMVCGLVVAVSPLVAGLYGEPRLARLLGVMAAAFVITPLGQQFQVLLEKELRFNRLAVVECAAAATSVGTSIVLAALRHGVWSLVWGQLAGTLVRSGSLAVIGWREWRPRLHFRRAEVRGYLRFGMFQVGERSVNFLAWNLDKLLIGSLLGATALGFYNVAYQLMVKPFQTLNPVLTRVAFPALAQAQDDDARLRVGYLDVLRAISLVMFPVYVGMIVVAEPLVQQVLGARWLPAVPVFQVLCVLGLFYSVGNPIGSLLLAKGRADVGFYFNVVGVCVYAAAIWIGSRGGVPGVATALVVGSAGVLYPLEFAVRWRLVRMRPGEYARALAPALATALAMGGVVLLVRGSVLRGNDLASLALMVAVGGAVYAAGTLVAQRVFLLRLRESLR